MVVWSWFDNDSCFEVVIKVLKQGLLLAQVFPLLAAAILSFRRDNLMAVDNLQVGLL